MSPWPGKCLALTATPADCRPRVHAALCSATSSGVDPKLRTPMTGLSAFELMSTSGAKFRLQPARRSSQPTRRPTNSVYDEVAEAAEHRVARVGRPRVVVEAGDVAALLVDRDDGVRVGLVDRIGQRAQLRAGDDVRSEDADPAQTVAEALGQPLGQRRPDETGQERRRDLAAEPVVRSGESGSGSVRRRTARSPLHRPADEPAGHPALHEQEEDDDRHGDERGRGHDLAPVDRRDSSSAG